ncbi:hypothetical protein Aduo_003937 [Ancylostoma duodenale]
MECVILLVLAFYSTTVSGATDGTFLRFCNNPPNFGTGNLDQLMIQHAFQGDKNKCVLTYNIRTDDDTSAYNFCDTQQPFTLLAARRQGSKTICEITTYYVCRGSDVLIGSKCFIPRKAVEIGEAGGSCGRDYTFYAISNGFEQKWITGNLPRTFFYFTHIILLID